MYNRIYESMFEGSMYGAGALNFAVWSYILAKMKPSREDGEFYVELNSNLIGGVLGEAPAGVAKSIEWLCSPDPQSRSPQNDGVRIVRQGQFLYRVVNGKKYNDIQNVQRRKEWMRNWQAKRRSKKNTPQLRERLADKAYGDGREVLGDRFGDPGQHRLKGTEAAPLESPPVLQNQTEGQHRKSEFSSVPGMQRVAGHPSLGVSGNGQPSGTADDSSSQPPAPSGQVGVPTVEQEDPDYPI